MKSTLLLLLLLVATTVVVVRGDGVFQVKLTDGYVLSWQVDGSNVHISLQGDFVAWMALGLNPNAASMIDADMMVARWDTDSPTVEDDYSVAHAPPQSDVSQGGAYNLVQISQAQTSKSSVANFSRALNTGDSKDYPIANGWTTTLWAHGTANRFQYHGGNRGILTLNWFTGEVLPPAPVSSLQLPANFELSVLTRVPNARNMALSDTGIIYVGSREDGTLSWFELSSPADVHQLASGLEMPNGVAFERGSLFVSTVTAITRYDAIDKTVRSSGRLPEGVVLATFEEPPSTQHAWKYLSVRDGVVYTSVNSPCNTCLYNETYGDFITFSAKDGSDRQVHFRGMRDTQGWAFDPRMPSRLYWSENGRDEWDPDHANRPPDELNVFDFAAPGNGSDTPSYGFPYAYGGGYNYKNPSQRDAQEPDAQYNPSLNTARYRPALFDFPPHVASLGVHFYQGSQFPESYRNALFVAFHGSWNSPQPVGYKIVVLRFNAGEPYDFQYQDNFVTGFLKPDNSVVGRPMSFLELDDGSLLFSDDLNGYIYKISYNP